MKPPASPHPFWSFEAPSRDPAAAREANASASRSPQQVKADRTTSLVREITDTATQERAAKVARLRQARLAQEGAEKAKPASTKKASGTKR